MGKARIQLDRGAIQAFCEAHAIRELALFGSVLRDDFRSDSDVDVLLEFEPSARVSLLDLVRIRDHLSQMLGRKADVVTKNSLSRHLKDKVLAGREVLYVRAG